MKSKAITLLYFIIVSFTIISCSEDDNPAVLNFLEKYDNTYWIDIVDEDEMEYIKINNDAVFLSGLYIIDQFSKCSFIQEGERVFESNAEKVTILENVEDQFTIRIEVKDSKTNSCTITFLIVDNKLNVKTLYDDGMLLESTLVKTNPVDINQFCK